MIGGCEAQTLMPWSLRLRAETNGPFRLGDHLFVRPEHDLFGGVMQMCLQILDIGELSELAAIECCDAHSSRFAQEFQLGCILGFPLLHEPQSLAEHLTGGSGSGRIPQASR